MTHHLYFWHPNLNHPPTLTFDQSGQESQIKLSVTSCLRVFVAIKFSAPLRSLRAGFLQVQQP